MRRKSHLLALNFVGILFFQGCYTQLAMFYPDPEIEEDSFYENYSHAPPRPGLDNYAQDGAGTSLELAYASMYNRFHSPYGMYYGINNYYNPYYNYGGYYNSYYGYNNSGYSYYLGGYSMFVPVSDLKELRSFAKDRSISSDTNLDVYRSSSKNTQSSFGRSSSISSTRSSGSISSGGSSASSSSSESSSGGRRATRRN